MDSPDAVRASPDLQLLLRHLHHQLHGRIAIVSGRSLAQIDTILGDVSSILFLSGSHGAEYQYNGRREASPRPAALVNVSEQMRSFTHGRPGVLIEEKTLGVALHYRRNPSAQSDALKLAMALATTHNLFIQNGKGMVELRAHGDDKGKALHRLMALPEMTGRKPIFVGDDVTDEAGFAAANAMGGYGVLVGESHDSAASFLLASPNMVSKWLKELCE